jgi:uncharacterized membrane protein
MDWIDILAFVAALGSALIAGAFYAFSAFIMAALARQPASQGIAAMQAINVTVLTPMFLGVFMGTAALSLVVAVVLAFAQEPGWLYGIAGAVLYVVGCFGVTMGLNVPLNDALARVQPESSEGAQLWQRYLVDWTRWNHVRTLASLIATAAFILYLVS